MKPPEGTSYGAVYATWKSIMTLIIAKIAMFASKSTTIIVFSSVSALEGEI